MPRASPPLRASWPPCSRAFALRWGVPSRSFAPAHGPLIVVEYLVELPREAKDALALVPASWACVSQTQKLVRYQPPEVAELVGDLGHARDLLAAAAVEAWRAFVRATDEELFAPLRGLVGMLADLDSLQSLAELAKREDWTRPVVPLADPAGGGPVRTLRARSARHPAVELLLEERGSGEGGAASFVANDFSIGDGCTGGGGGSRDARPAKADLRGVVLTGPNLGGKSCYVRTAGVLVVLAQMGSWLPAASATVGTFERILTRMGGQDDLIRGKSTFENELCGVGRMLGEDRAPKKGRQTLLLLDELGRGTSTFDGMAIATATLEHIVTRMECLCYFVTHFPIVTELQSAYPDRVANGHMGYDVDEAGRIVFLFEFRWGAAGGSYGINVARLAGVDPRVLKVASQKAAEAEAEDKERRAARGRGWGAR